MTERTLAHDWFPQPIPENVTIGEGSWLYSSFAFLHYRSRRGVRIGDHTGVYAGTFFELGPEGEVDIGDYCSIVGAIVRTNRRVSFGDHCFVAHEVVVSDAPAPVPAVDATPDGPGVEVASNVWIGARAVLLGGARIGEGSIVGAASVVRGEIPPYSIAVGNPARVAGPVPRSVGQDSDGGPANVHG